MTNREIAIAVLEKLYEGNPRKNNDQISAQNGINFVLLYLGHSKQKEINAGDLAKALDCSTARIAAILNSIEEKGYVERKTSDKDKRKTIVVLTDKGIEAVNAIKEESIEYLEIIMEKIGVDRFVQTLTALAEIRDIINEENEKRGR